MTVKGGERGWRGLATAMTHRKASYQPAALRDPPNVSGPRCLRCPPARHHERGRERVRLKEGETFIIREVDVQKRD